MIPLPVHIGPNIYAVTGSMVGGEFRAESVRCDSVEIRPLLAVTGRLREVEAFAEWEMRTVPSGRVVAEREVGK